MADRKMTLRERARAWWQANGRSFDEALPPGEQGYLAGWHARGRADRVTRGSVVLSKEVVAFLCGDGPLDGRWYGEVDDELRCKANRPAPYWWRRYLRAKGRK